jgi:PAS domain S-box-containing protein
MENTFGMNIIPENEPQRIAALKRYKILDTPPENAFDNVARLATQIFKVPISLVSLVDAGQVFFKANIGMGRARITARGVSLCSLAVMQNEVTVFENALKEPCLLANPNVAGDFGLRFYAGAPLITHDGFLIGTLCIIDQTPRTFTKDDRMIMESLAKIVMDEIELRLSGIEESEKQQQYIEETAAINEELMVSNNELQQIQEDVLLAYSRLRESEEIREIAIVQAKLGLWYIDAVTRAFVPSDRLKEFFGYGVNELMSYEAAVLHIRDDYRKKVTLAVDAAIESGMPYDLEYPIIGLRDQKLRWVRATGKLNPAEDGRKSYFSGTIMDITEQKEDEQRKNDFISIVSHELKTPLTSMNGYIQMLTAKARKNDDAFAVSLLDKANRQTKKMGTMINGFLNMKRLESGKIYIDKQQFDIAALFIEAEEETFATIASHNLIFAPVESCMINADRDKIGQVITNLISNAVKYSPPASTINVACFVMGQSILVSIKDQGIGVSEADRLKLFERFYRVENAETENINGFGIGLYLCNEIIARHDGKIWLDSVPGEGSVAYFSIPV